MDDLNKTDITKAMKLSERAIEITMRAFYRNKSTFNLLQLWFWDSIGTENIPRIASPSATFCCLGIVFSRLLIAC